MEDNKPNAKGGISGFASVLQDVRKETQENFFDRMKDYPCSFNIGHASIVVDDENSENVTAGEPQVSQNKWMYLIENLENDEEDDFEEPFWKENLLTRAYEETELREKARQLNQEVLGRSQNRNLVALANKAFLHHFDGQINETNEVIEQLQILKETPSFRDLKIDAVSEQAYSFRKFGGALHLLASLTLLGVTRQYRPLDEKLQYMEALVLRRCTHINLYSEAPERIDRSKFCLNAAKSLYRLGTQARSERIQAAALIELAYLRYDEDPNYIVHSRSRSGSGTKKPMLEENVWRGIVGSDDWKTLRDKALDIEKDPSEKVLKMAGQLYRYAGGEDNREKSKQLLLRANMKKSTNRAHHHLGLTYRSEATKFEKENNPTPSDQQTYSQRREDSHFQVLPDPPEDCRPGTLEQRLRCLTRITKNNLKPFSENNPHVSNALHHFKLAVKKSWNQNVPALFDLAKMYATTYQYDECLKTCKILTDNGFAEIGRHQHPLLTVSAYDLYGMCCIMKANETNCKKSKENLLNEAETMLMFAVRLAAQLASGIPELKTCASDLWNAFAHLEKEFIFHGSEDSRKKLFALYNLLNGYNYKILESIDKLIAMGKSDYLTQEAVEIGVRSYLDMKDFKGALAFNEIIPLRTGGRLEKLTWCSSITMQKVMLGYVEQMLSTPPLQLDNGEHLMQRLPVWKEMFCQEFLDSDRESIKSYDVVIVQDEGENWQPRPGSKSDTAAKVLKNVLEKFCGLRVARAHEDAEWGQKFHEECKVISSSRVAIFVLADDEDTPCKQLDLPDNAVPVVPMERGDGSTWSRQSDADVTENTLVKQFNSSVSLQDDQKDKKDELTSAPFNFIFNCSIAEHVENKQPAHIVLITVGDCHVQLQALLPLSRSFRSSRLSLTEEDIFNLSRAPLGQMSDQSCDLIMKLFKAIVRKP